MILMDKEETNSYYYYRYANLYIQLSEIPGRIYQLHTA